MRALPATISRAAHAAVEALTNPRLGSFIDGAQRDAPSADSFVKVDPYSGEDNYCVVESTVAEVDQAVRSASAAQRVWAAMPACERAAVLLRIADAVEGEAELFGLMDTLDNGKLFRETRSQAHGVAHSLRYAAGGGERLEGVTAPASSNDVWAMTIHVPLGVIGVIVPWNSPLPLTVDTAGPALAAGNAVVVKTPENTPASVVHFASLAVANGLPPGVLNVVSGSGGTVGEALAEHPGIAKIVFTGGTEVGRRVAVAAAGRFLPCVLELGGKSAQIVMPDADLERVVPGLVSGVFAAAGQTCVAGGRALVHRDVYDFIVEQISESAARIVLGDPLDDATQMGPLASASQLTNVMRHVDRALEAGARLASGGGTRSTGVGQGTFFEPTVFADVMPSNPVFSEEVFGPVLGITPFDSFDEAITLANDTRYGLAASIWTSSIDTALAATRRLIAGTVWVNTYRAPEMAVPAGGFKESGNGRLGGSRGAYEFVQEKSIIIDHSGTANDPFVMGGGRQASPRTASK